MSNLMHKNLCALDEEALKNVNGGVAIAAAGTISEAAFSDKKGQYQCRGDRKADVVVIDDVDIQASCRRLVIKR